MFVFKWFQNLRNKTSSKTVKDAPVARASPAEEADYNNYLVEKGYTDYIAYVLSTIDDAKEHEAILRMTLNGLKYKLNHDSNISTNSYIDITIMIARNLYHSIGQIVSLQPISYPVSQIYTMAYYKGDSPVTNVEEYFIDETLGSDLQLRILSKMVESIDQKYQSSLMVSGGFTTYAKEVARQITEEIVDKIYGHLVASSANSQYKMPSDIFQAPNELAIAIFDASSDIAASTRIGRGNFLVTNPMGVSLLQQSNVWFIPAVEDSRLSNLDLPIRFCGTIGDMKVYYKTDMLPINDLNSTTLVGFKSPDNDWYAGYVYSPYVLLEETGSIINPITMGEIVSIRGKHGYTETNMNYYRSITVVL